MARRKGSRQRGVWYAVRRTLVGMNSATESIVISISLRAFSNSSFVNIFPCQLSLFSKNETPLPLMVLAIIMVGDWLVFWYFLTSSKAFLTFSKSCPSSTKTVFQPKALKRFWYVSMSQPIIVSPLWPRRLTSKIAIRLLSL